VDSANAMQNVISNKILDSDLVFFAEAANKYGLSVGVTLFSKGAVIAGSTISGKAYYERLVKSLGPYEHGSKIEIVADYLNGAKKEYEVLSEASDDYNYLHLEKISIISTGDKVSPFNDALLRINIGEVEGYILGSPNS
jgi:hypothetical protein